MVGVTDSFDQEETLRDSKRLIIYLSVCVCVCVCVCSVAQSCLTLCNPMDGSPPGSSVNGTLQARILEWVAISYSNLIVLTYILCKEKIEASFYEMV